MNTYHKSTKGFTLLEILIVIAALGILATIVILAINPGAIFAGLRNGQRAPHMRDLNSAFGQWEIDAQRYGLDVEALVAVAAEQAGIQNESLGTPAPFDAVDHDLEDLTHDDQGNGAGSRGIALVIEETGQAIQNGPPNLVDDYCEGNESQGEVPGDNYDAATGPIYPAYGQISLDEIVTADPATTPPGGINTVYTDIIDQDLNGVQTYLDIPQDPQPGNCYTIQIPAGYDGTESGDPIQVAAPFAEQEGDQRAPLITQGITF